MNKSLYQDHFGIRENPFSIIPDPHYLYMSKRHQEALAHLMYGINGSGGFVLLTGEVGTGKTTICRALIEHLDENVELALILNPKLSEAELMASICDELHISYPEDTDSLKVFFDVLTRYLLKAHANGRNPVLMIDEAQNLTSPVIELVRLLTNLETSQKKLLQIILVGQPELNHILSQEDQRQTAQRITARYHLMPLGLSECHNYIRHRLSIAGLDENVFSAKAVKMVHESARGIPRLMNSICDRALLAAYVEGRKYIDKKLAKAAANEVLGGATEDISPSGYSVWGSMVLVLVIFGLMMWVGFDPLNSGFKNTLSHFFPSKNTPPRAEQQTAPKHHPKLAKTEFKAPNSKVTSTPDRMLNPKKALAPAQKPLSAPSAIDAVPAQLGSQDISKLEGTALENLIQTGTPDFAFQNLFARWHQNYDSLKGFSPCNKAQQVNLSCIQGRTNIKGLKAINRPLVASIVMPDGQHVFGVVDKIVDDGTNETISFSFGDRTLSMKKKAFSLRWPGDYLVLWKPPTLIKRTLNFGLQGRDVRELRRLLALAGFADGANDIKNNGSIFFGPSLRRKVKKFQKANGLANDGVVNAQTLMWITGSAKFTTVPVIYTKKG